MPVAGKSDRSFSIASLERICNFVVSDRDTEAIIHGVISEICINLGADAGWVQLYDPEKDELKLLCYNGLNSQIIRDFNRCIIVLLQNRVMRPSVLDSGILIRTDAISANSSLQEYESLAIVPLRLGKKNLGFIGIGSKTRSAFSEIDLKLLYTLSAYLIHLIRPLASAYWETGKRKDCLISNINDKQELFATLGHELQTPLTALIASAGLLQEDMDKDAKPSHLRLIQNIMKSALNLQNRIMELLELSRNRTSQLKINLKIISFTDYLNEVIEGLLPLAKSKNQSLIIEIPPVKNVIADEQRLNQILLNLLSNAMKFTPRDGTVIISARENGSNLIIEIHDSGPGISKREQMKLFSPYYRTPKDRLQAPGLGLGLYITKQLVELLGGSIWLDSEVGKGSTFAFSLPLEEVKSSKGRQ